MVAVTPAWMANLAPFPGRFSIQQTFVPIGSAPSGWASPSLGLTIKKKLITTGFVDSKSNLWKWKVILTPFLVLRNYYE